jgi:hypothetical protein
VATSNVEIAYNQIVGCVTTGIVLAMGLDQIAHDNTVVSAGMTPAGVPYVWAWLGRQCQTGGCCRRMTATYRSLPFHALSAS